MMDYQRYSPTGFSLLPPVIKNLLIINGIFFLAQITISNVYGIQIEDYLGLRYFLSDQFQIFQVITYMFLHSTANISHLLFNMLALWMFGYLLENIWGSKKFLTYYLITGIGAGLVHYAVFYFQINPVVQGINNFLANPDLPTLDAFIGSHQFQLGKYSGEIWNEFVNFQKNYRILNLDENDRLAMQGAVSFLAEYKQYLLGLPNVIGASGAVFGILLAFGMMFPNMYIYIYFLFPIKAKYFVIIYGVIELISGFYDTGGNVAHFAHLGGMVFGFFMIMLWRKNKRF